MTWTKMSAWWRQCFFDRHIGNLLHCFMINLKNWSCFFSCSFLHFVFHHLYCCLCYLWEVEVIIIGNELITSISYCSSRPTSVYASLISLPICLSIKFISISLVNKWSCSSRWLYQTLFLLLIWKGFYSYKHSTF